MTIQELAKEIGETLLSAKFDFQATDARILRESPGMEDYDNTLDLLDLLKAIWGLQDEPGAFGMRLDRFLRGTGYQQGIHILRVGESLTAR
eukprot:4239788-Prorocentrum_lima.AAC.1